MCDTLVPLSRQIRFTDVQKSRFWVSWNRISWDIKAVRISSVQISKQDCNYVSMIWYPIKKAENWEIRILSHTVIETFLECFDIRKYIPWMLRYPETGVQLYFHKAIVLDIYIYIRSCQHVICKISVNNRNI